MFNTDVQLTVYCRSVPFFVPYSNCFGCTAIEVVDSNHFVCLCLLLLLLLLEKPCQTVEKMCRLSESNIYVQYPFWWFGNWKNSSMKNCVFSLYTYTKGNRLHHTHTHTYQSHVYAHIYHARIQT